MNCLVPFECQNVYMNIHSIPKPHPCLIALGTGLPLECFHWFCDVSLQNVGPYPVPMAVKKDVGLFVEIAIISV